MDADRDREEDGGLIDVTGIQLDELAAAVDEPSLHRALDRILSVNDNGAGFHGFNNKI